MSLLESNLNEVQKKEFRNAFDLFDQDKDGAISKDDLEKVSALLGLNKSPGEIRDMFNEVDKANTGAINFLMFSSALDVKLRNTDSEEVLRKAFEAFDPEKRGYIPASELKKELQSWGEPLTDDEMYALFKEVGCAEGGAFNYELFLSQIFMKKSA